MSVGHSLVDALKREILILIEKHNVTLGVPLEARVKEWDSIEEKIGRKDIKMESVHNLDDLIGIRIIVLFQKDITVVKEFIKEFFVILGQEDTSCRLDSNQFGYLSEHLIIKIPEEWLNIPSYSEFRGMKAEVQLRTLSQHTWAVASHKLQYKREDSVPVPVRRAIHRVSALLETVDLEFTRVLSERDIYLTTVDEEVDQTLNVDLVLKSLEEKLPRENRSEDEPVDELLSELRYFGIKSKVELDNFIDRNKFFALKEDKDRVQGVEGRISKGVIHSGRIFYRVNNGVYYTHSELVRKMLEKEFGRKKVLDAQTHLRLQRG